jgi:hypothetical protein
LKYYSDEEVLQDNLKKVNLYIYSRTLRYSWNIVNVGVKHQSIKSINIFSREIFNYMYYLCLIEEIIEHKIICNTCKNSRNCGCSWFPEMKKIQYIRLEMFKKCLYHTLFNQSPYEHLHSGVRVTRYLVLCVWFVDRCLSFCTFSFGHCSFVIFKLFFVMSFYNCF